VPDAGRRHVRAPAAQRPHHLAPPDRPDEFYWVGENTAVTESNPTTGQVAMQARKGGVLTRVPNELFRFASVAADGLIRTDMAKSIALGIDYAGLYGTGSAAQPKGLTLYTGTNEMIDYAGSPRPRRGSRPTATCCGRRTGTGWSASSRTATSSSRAGSCGRRSPTTSGLPGRRRGPADAAGQFVQAMMRAISDKMPGDNWCGYPVTKSAVVKNTRRRATRRT
jgi:hypothetical protein